MSLIAKQLHEIQIEQLLRNIAAMKRSFLNQKIRILQLIVSSLLLSAADTLLNAKYIRGKCVTEIASFFSAAAAAAYTYNASSLTLGM